MGLAYLATFVYAANSIGVAGYSIQLMLGLGPDGKGKAGAPGGDIDAKGGQGGSGAMGAAPGAAAAGKAEGAAGPGQGGC